MKDKLMKIIMQESLINRKPTIESIKNSTIEENNKSIYLGTGLSSSKKVSIGTPFDLLSMILIANKVKNEIGSTTIYHNIADLHAATNNFTNKELEEALKKQEENITKITESLDIKEYKILKSSQFHETEEYQKIISKINIDKHKYVQKEIADIEYFRQQKKAGIKIGWSIKSNSTSFDEVFFDKQYKEIFGNKIISIYTVPGKRLDDKAPNAAPYILTEDEINSRIIFKENEQVAKKLNENDCSKQTQKTVKKYLTAITRLYQETIEPLEGNLDNKISYIISKAFNEVKK